MHSRAPQSTIIYAFYFEMMEVILSAQTVELLKLMGVVAVVECREIIQINGEENYC